MTPSRELGRADLCRLDNLIRRSNADLHTAMTAFTDGGYRHVGESLRSGSPPDALVQRFLDELQLMQDYVGTSYRVSQITRDGVVALRRGRDRRFADRGAQCAFVVPSNAAAWAMRVAAVQQRDDTCWLFSIFDESVPQKNLSSALLADCVVVPPGAPLRLKALRNIAARGTASPGPVRIVAHFARADQACGPAYDLYSGALLN